MLEKFFPDEYLDSTYSIDFEELYRKGFRGIIFDIDNTLVPHGAPADKRAEELFARLKKIGFSCCLLSNNQYERSVPLTKISRFILSRTPISRPERTIRKLWSLWGRIWKIRFLSGISFLQMYTEPKGQGSTIFW